MKASEVYLRAAEWLDNNPINIMAYACMSVAPDENHGDRLMHIRKLLGDEYIDSGDIGTYCVLTLLFMSEIAKDEEKP